jgi:type I restriction enzyme M protein
MSNGEGTPNAGQEEDLLTPEERRNLRLRRLEGKTRFRNLKSLLMEIANKLRSTTGADSDDYLGIMVGMIFIKRASDQFQYLQDQLAESFRQEALSPEQIELELTYRRNYHSGMIYSPPEARWVTHELNGICQIQAGQGVRLREAVQALQNSNPGLGRTLSRTVRFTMGNDGVRVINDAAYKSFIDKLTPIDFSDASLEQTDLLGAIYEFITKDFNDEKKSKAGEHYTPRELVDLLVQLIEPRNGDLIYDPTSGSGGMLTYSHRYVENHEGHADDLWLYGQEMKPVTQALSILNMVFHGVSNHDIKQGNTLTKPMLKNRNGGLKKFDKIIANMPFSVGYEDESLTLMSRFQYGMPNPLPSKRADFLFVQHMLSSLKANGIIVTVCSTGILFREGKESEIRQSLIENDLIQAVIAVPANLFGTTGTSVALLVMRRRGQEKPPSLRNKVLFINAESEFGTRATQNFLRPQDIAKIIRYHQIGCSNLDEEILLENYARRISIEEIEENNFSLNVRLYVDSSKPPPPQNVRSHLRGAIPVQEIEDIRSTAINVGLDIDSIFTDFDGTDKSFSENLGTIRELATHLRNQPGVIQSIEHLNLQVDDLLQSLREMLQNLNGNGEVTIPQFIEEVVNLAVDELNDVPQFNDLEIRGMVAGWAKSIELDLGTIRENGLDALIEAWASIVITAINEKGSDLTFTELRLRDTVLPGRWDRISELGSIVANSTHERNVLDYGDDYDSLSKEEKQEIGKESDRKSNRSDELTDEHIASVEEDERVTLVAERESVEQWLQNYNQIESQRAAANREKRQLSRPDNIRNAFLDNLGEFNSVDCQEIALNILIESLQNNIHSTNQKIVNEVIDYITSLYERYNTNLRLIEGRCEQSKQVLDNNLEVLGYDNP